MQSILIKSIMKTVTHPAGSITTVPSDIQNQDQMVLPVIKLSFDGFLLFANSAGVEFLDVLSDYTKKSALTQLIKKYPTILNKDTNMDICIQLYETCYYFSVIAFREGGYTGIYGYRSVRKCCDDSRVA